jgi:hypothetical protein
MKKESDEFCEKIVMVLTMSEENIRFNELHRRLAKLGAKMSKPTLIMHLNHLIENGTIQRDEQDKQNVSYGVDWKKFKQLAKAQKMNETALHLIRNEKIFKSRTLSQQTYFTAAMLTIGELFYLKLNILNILEPENKLQNYFSYTLIRQFYNIYAALLYESCKESKENSLKILHHIDKFIKTLRESLFEINPEATQQKPEDKVGILREF